MQLSNNLIQIPYLNEGKSNIDNKTIVVIITGLDNKTSNKKTGDMLQTVDFIKDHAPKLPAKNWFK